MDTPEIERHAWIGGSDIAAIMGLGATYGGVTATPFTVWQKKVGEAPESMDPERRRFLDRRKRWEGPIFEMLREEFAAEIVATNRRYRDKEHEFFTCEVDFEWVDPVRDVTGSVQNGEIKTVSPFAFGERSGWGEAGTADVPVHYAAQVMWGLGITGRRVCVLAAMVGLDNMIFYRVERDDETIAAMRAKALEFWTCYVLPKEPPPPQSASDVDAMLLRRRARPVELDEAALGKLKELNRVRQSMSAFKHQEEELEVDLGSYVLARWGEPTADLAAPQAEDASLRAGGLVVATWKKGKREFIDGKRLKAERPEIAAEFTRETPFRVLRFVKPKT